MSKNYNSTYTTIPKEMFFAAYFFTTSFPNFMRDLMAVGAV